MGQATTTSRSQSTPPAAVKAILTFEVGEQVYGLPVTDVTRIIEMVTIIRLPEVPEIIRGIINLQGKVVPVVDLRHCFDLSPKPYGLHTPIVLVELEGDARKLGLIVDTVQDVVEVPLENFEMIETVMPADLAAAITGRAGHLAGIAKIDRQILLILNVRALLSGAEQAALTQALDSNGKWAIKDGSDSNEN